MYINIAFPVYGVCVLRNRTTSDTSEHTTCEMMNTQHVRVENVPYTIRRYQTTNQHKHGSSGTSHTLRGLHVMTVDSHVTHIKSILFLALLANYNKMIMYTIYLRKREMKKKQDKKKATPSQQFVMEIRFHIYIPYILVQNSTSRILVEPKKIIDFEEQHFRSVGFSLSFAGDEGFQWSIRTFEELLFCIEREASIQMHINCFS
eukprot:gene6177-4455_t